MGCFAQGCLTAVIVVVVLAVVGGGGAWWIYHTAINSFTSDQSANVAIDEPGAAEFQQAKMRLEHLRAAIRSKTETTIQFSAADLNALIAREPGFTNLRGRLRVNLSGDDMILDMSVPLDKINFPGLKGRWFNGRAEFGFNYNIGEFSFAAHAIEANGHRMENTGKPGFNSSFLQNFSTSYSRKFNQGFRQGQEKSPQGHEFWKQIKSMSVQDGQLVVVTQAGEMQ